MSASADRGQLTVSVRDDGGAAKCSEELGVLVSARIDFGIVTALQQ